MQAVQTARTPDQRHDQRNATHAPLHEDGDQAPDPPDAYLPPRARHTTAQLTDIARIIRHEAPWLAAADVQPSPDLTEWQVHHGTHYCPTPVPPDLHLPLPRDPAATLASVLDRPWCTACETIGRRRRPISISEIAT